MKVTCPKCQFENQADSSRVVCARCATIIEVRMDQGFDSNGKRQTARLPFTSGGLSGGGCVRFRTGAGIVADSDPVRELEETRAKARGMLKALGVDA